VVVNVSEYLRSTAEATPDRTAIIGVGADRRELSYSDLDTAADSIARALTGRGLVAGAPVGLVMANRVDLPIAYFGIVRGGMVAVPLNPRSTPDEIRRRLADAKVKLVLCDETGAAAVREAVAGQGCAVVVDGIEPEGSETSFHDFISEAADVTPAASRDPESLAAILYTSGSSGQPRGVMLSHRALAANIEQAAAVEPPLVTSDDVVLGLLPMFHIYGLNAVLGFTVRAGARIVMVDGFDPAGLLETIRAERITNIPLAPPVIAAWAGRDDLRAAMEGVRVVVSGASPLDPALAAEFEASAGRPVDQGYGMTETAPVLATTLAAHEPGQSPKPGSVGRPLPGVEVRILDTHGEPAAPGDVGEVSVRGDNLFSGHWPPGPDGRGSEGPDAEGWFATGDLGFLDDDGDLTIVDRLKDVVIVSGFNVYPSEVEDVISGAEGVAEVAVVGVPDESTGEAVLAFVVPDAEADTAGLRDVIDERCREKLARFKQPTNIVVVSGLPYSATGKIAKERLRAMARRSELNLEPGRG
jgi:long-chain acyl-CoA synthetase